MPPREFKSGLAQAIDKYIKNNTSYFGDIMENGLGQLSNPKWEDFANTGIRRKEALVNNSITHGLVRQAHNDQPAGTILGSSYNKYANVLYASLDGTKANRIYEYRLMASYPEVSDAIEEITNSFINEDERGEVIHFDYIDEELPIDVKAELKREFMLFTNHFNLKKNGKKYCQDFLIDGELFLELIMNNNTPENKKMGILGVLKMQTELMDVVYKDKYNGIVGAFIGKQLEVNDENNPTQVTKLQPVPFQPNQIFYISTNNFDPTGQWIVPYIERARKRYIQLSYLEDSIIIYRLVRAPERMVFTVDTGNMTTPKAEAYLNSLKQSYWKQKSFDFNTGDIMQKFEPTSMLDAYWVPKDKVKIDTLQGGQNLGQLDDLNYFIQALYRALRVPTSRLNPEYQKTADNSNILQEEIRFAEFIISLQNIFAEEIKQTFITHLKLRGIYQHFHLRENWIKIDFEPPSNYYKHRKLQGIQIAGQAFSALAGNDCLSKSYLMKHLLGMDNGEIVEQYTLRKTEAGHEWEIQQILSGGPGWKTTMLTQADGKGEAGGGGGMGGLDALTGGGDGDLGLGGDDLGGDMGDMGGMEGGDEAEVSQAMDEPMSTEAL